jgi:hypothetical protein
MKATIGRSAFECSLRVGTKPASQLNILLTPNRLVAHLTVSLPVVKIGALRTVLRCHLTQTSLKSLNLLTIFQADDKGSIPFTRPNLFNDLRGVRPTYCVMPDCCFASLRSDLRLPPAPRRTAATPAGSPQNTSCQSVLVIRDGVWFFFNEVRGKRERIPPLSRQL